MTHAKRKTGTAARGASDILAQRVEWLKDAFPDIFTEGKVDHEKLRASLQELKEATVEEKHAQSQLEKFARPTPLSPTEDIKATDGDALMKALERESGEGPTAEETRKVSQACATTR